MQCFAIQVPVVDSMHPSALPCEQFVIPFCRATSLRDRVPGALFGLRSAATGLVGIAQVEEKLRELFLSLICLASTLVAFPPYSVSASVSRPPSVAHQACLYPFHGHRLVCFPALQQGILQFPVAQVWRQICGGAHYCCWCGC